MDTIDGGKWLPDQDLAWTLVTTRGRAHPRARERARVLLRPQSRRHHPPEGVRGPDVRSHRAQGRPHRHRDHQPAGGAGVGAGHRAPRGASRGRAHQERRTAPRIAGVLMIDIRTGEFVFVQAKAVLLATGGGPTMYKFHTPSGDKSCDGLAMALRAGPAVARHGDGAVPPDGPPRRHAHAHDRDRARGRPARRRRLSPERRRQPLHAATTTRAASARRATSSRASMFREMREGRTTPHGGLYIEMRHLGPDNVRRQFKGMVERCADCGFDLAGGRVEVVPTAHYMMGGVVFRARLHDRRCPGLFAAGEDTGGVHGANRLGGNGVANSTVFGGIAGETMAAWVRRNEAHPSRRDGDRREHGDARGAVWRAARRSGRASARTLYDVHVGRRRDPARCAGPCARESRRSMSWTRGSIAPALPDRSRVFNVTWHDWLNLKNLIAVSRVIAVAALAREDSRGAHFREDFPEAGPLDSSAYGVVRQVDERLTLSERPGRVHARRAGRDAAERGLAGAPSTCRCAALLPRRSVMRYSCRPAG